MFQIEKGKSSVEDEIYHRLFKKISSSVISSQPQS